MKKSWLIGITLSANIVSPNSIPFTQTKFIVKVNFDSKQQQQQQKNCSKSLAKQVSLWTNRRRA